MPRYLIDIFMLMRDELSDSLIKRYLSLFLGACSGTGNDRL